MKRRAIHEVPVAKLVCDFDLNDRVTLPRVAELAESIEKQGLLHPPIVQYGTFRVVTGRDRISAHVALGKETIRVEFWDFNDELEIQQVTEAENAMRRHDKGEQVAAQLKLVDIYEQQIRAAEEEAKRSPGPKPYGDRKSPRTKARERVAEEFGVTPEAVRKNEQRDKKRKTAELAERGHTRPHHIRVVDYTSPSEQWLEGMDRFHDMLSQVDAALRGANALITKFENMGAVKLHDAHITLLKEGIQEMAAKARGMRPYEVCSICKQVPEVQARCFHCGQAGYSTILQREFVPSEASGPVVQFNGKWVTMESLGYEVEGVSAPAPAQEPPELEEPEGDDTFFDDIFSEQLGDSIKGGE